MLNRIYSAKIKKAFEGIDWRLLLFLVLFLNVKLLVKLAAILFIYILQFNYKFGFRWRNSRLPLFYPMAIAIGIYNYFLLAGFSNRNYSIAFFTGLFFWTISILAIHQVKLFVERNSVDVIHKTITVFLLLNAIFSLCAFILIVVETGSINPYQYQGEYQKYFIGTGDYIRGVSFDTSTTNAVLNAFGVIYFLKRKSALMVLLCMIILLLTGSNLTNLLLAAILLFLFIFYSNKDQKSVIVICFLFLIIFLAKISPQNNNYVIHKIDEIFKNPTSGQIQYTAILPLRERPDSTLSDAERKEKTATLYLDSLYQLQNKRQPQIAVAKDALSEQIEIPGADIHTPPYQHRSIPSPLAKKIAEFGGFRSFQLPIPTDPGYHSKLPGKIIAMKQTRDFFRQDPSGVITGAGIGNFSSKLAFKTTSLNIAGSYPEKFAYLHPAFIANHLDLYFYYFTKEEGRHSIVNSPNSVYDQLLSEYGLLGTGAFFLFYLGFFIRKAKDADCGIPLIGFLAAIFFMEYWFEQLSVVIFFELLFFLNLKEGAKL